MENERWLSRWHKGSKLGRILREGKGDLGERLKTGMKMTEDENKVENGARLQGN